MQRDNYDLPLTTASGCAAAHYREGVDRMLSAWYGADEAFDRAIQQDPDFALAHIALARIHQLSSAGSIKFVAEPGSDYLGCRIS